MKKDKRQRKPRKELPLALNIILVLLFSVVYLFFSICLGFEISALLNNSIEEEIGCVYWSLISGIIYMALLFILVRNSDSENVQPLKWYINCLCISITWNFVIAALTVLALGAERDLDINYAVGFLMFKMICIIVTPNIVKYVKHDTEKWKGIFYNNGNLDSKQNTKDFYRVHAPVEFEKKLLWAVIKNQFLNVAVVIAIMIFVVLLCLYRMVAGYKYTTNVLYNIAVTRAKRRFGLIFFLSVFFVAFGIPIIAFYLANAFKKIRVVRKHEYFVYHAIVSSVKSGKIAIYKEGRHYNYNYCTCVGIREKKVNNTEAILIFVPDDVFLFPVNDKYKIEEFKSTKSK